jgi:DNA-binding transcriptional regulator YiaG
MAQTHFTPKQLAERLQISEYTLASWRCKGEGPKFMKFGKAVRYSVESVSEWEIDKTKSNTSQ